MKIIEPKAELIEQIDPIEHIAKCASVCYGKDEAKNPKALYERLKQLGHLSVFRHESIYAIIPNHDRELKDLALYYASCPYINIHVFDEYTYVSTNKQFIMDNKDYPFIKLIQEYKVNKHDFISIEEHRQITLPMLRYTFKVITQISTSRELNRVSPNNITERSTRYVYEDGTICKPHWMTDEEVNYLNNEPIFEEWCDSHKKASIFRDSCNDSFNKYKLLVDIGMQRQDARGVLPLDTATEVVYTYSIREWEHIIELRADKRAHPNAQIIANMVKDKLQELGYGKAG